MAYISVKEELYNEMPISGDLPPPCGLSERGHTVYSLLCGSVETYLLIQVSQRGATQYMTSLCISGDLPPNPGMSERGHRVYSLLCGSVETYHLIQVCQRGATQSVREGPHSILTSLWISGDLPPNPGLPERGHTVYSLLCGSVETYLLIQVCQGMARATHFPLISIIYLFLQVCQGGTRATQNTHFYSFGQLEVGLALGRKTGTSLEEQEDREETSSGSSTSSRADKPHHFRVATAILPCTSTQPYGLLHIPEHGLMIPDPIKYSLGGQHFPELLLCLQRSQGLQMLAALLVLSADRNKSQAFLLGLGIYYLPKNPSEAAMG
ncbi:hypothetical protein MAR_010274, partial [Mya arenaria]